VAALGTDTGGSVRIPAAVCGIVGFKPTARRVPIDSVVPLSTSLDSIGPLANSVECCAIVDAVFAGESIAVPEAMPLAGLRLAVPRHFVMDDLDPLVAKTFERGLRALAAKAPRSNTSNYRNWMSLRPSTPRVASPQPNPTPGTKTSWPAAATNTIRW